MFGSTLIAASSGASGVGSGLETITGGGELVGELAHPVNSNAPAIVSGTSQAPGFREFMDDSLLVPGVLREHADEALRLGEGRLHARPALFSARRTLRGKV